MSCPNESPYALKNLLPSGTIKFKLVPSAPQIFCDFGRADDGWYQFRGGALLPHLAVAADGNLSRELDFLIKYHFLAASCCFCAPTTVIVRLYIIPYDLGNVQGKLRVRKDTILAPARRSLRTLLPRIAQDRESWDGNDFGSPSGPSIVSIYADNDVRTLAQIYGDLPSPSPQKLPGGDNIIPRFLDFADNLEDFGMRSVLYNYQRRSVAAMIQRELDLRDVPDPLFVPIRDMDGSTFYLQPGTMEVLQERPMVAPSRGGVLCEELGTGKTVMILALILATMGQLATPEESVLDARPIMTPMAFRHFPSSSFAACRKRFFEGKGEIEPQVFQVPSLVELLLHRSRTSPDLGYEEHVEGTDLLHLRAANVPFYHEYLGEPTDNERKKRNQYNPAPRTMYLTTATLIVVPSNLISQWSQEINKHCYSTPRVLLLRSTQVMPPVKALASDYDIILMTYARFTAEDRRKDVAKSRSWKTCTCPEFPRARIPDCQCKDPDVSPLLQIRWKRLVIDEGHVSATLSTTLTPFAKLLSVERRWIVTGTPTTNLLGLSLGKKTNDESQKAESDDLDDGDDRYDYSDTETSVGDSSEASSFGDNPPTTPLHPRIWTKFDRADVQKLGIMITHFVGIPQFTADSSLVRTHIIDALLDDRGPRPGAIQVLNQVMEMVMIRHRIDDVENDIILPPIKQESILLDLDPFAVKSYNAMQATVAINAVDSQRTDQDYMFHPANVDSLQRAVANMTQIMFWSVDDDLYNVDQLLQDSEEYLQKAIKRKMPQEDLILLQDALLHVRSAAKDPLWRAIQAHEDVPFRVYNMDHQVLGAWTRTTGSEPRSNIFTGFMHSDRLRKMHNALVRRPLTSMDRFVELGLAVAEEDREQRRLYQESLTRLKGDKTDHRAARHRDEVRRGASKATRAAKKAAAPEKLKEIRKELGIALARLEELQDEEETSHSNPSTAVPSQPSTLGITRLSWNLLSSSALAHVRVGSSASSKLNYIINEVIQHAPKEKFLVFSQSPLTLAHIAEALELIQVKYLQFTTQVPPQVREQLVMTFETSHTFRVFLMELKHGARGLNLISASRVIFCEPVWQVDVESQAIKRAHRIGQTKPISVKTLAIRGTAEENMVARRNALKGSYNKLPKLIEEAGMRHYIANPKFINSQSTSLPTLDIPLFYPSSKEERYNKTPMVIVTGDTHTPSTSNQTDEVQTEDKSPRKKRKGVKFSD